MSEFNAKYIKISSKYLQDKINSLKVKESTIFTVDTKKDSSIKKFVSSLFKS